MNYTSEVTINLPRERVVALFDDPESLPKWQPGLQSFELMEGEAGQPAAKSRLVYKEGGRRVEMVETIISRNLPQELSATYDAPNVHNIVINHFDDLGERTRWTMENEFQCGGWMRLMTMFMGGAFRKTTQRDKERFKEFAEKPGLTVGNLPLAFETADARR